MTESNSQADFELDGWRIRPRLHRIEGPGGTRQLEPKVMETLVVLADRPGEVFSRAELMERIWPEVVVGEEVLTRCVSELRRALGDDRQYPRFVETIRKGGYRLLAIPRQLSEAAPPRRAPWLRLAIPLLIVLGALLGYLAFSGRDTVHVIEPKSEGWQVLPLTTYPGNEMTPALSPDGERVAFCWDGTDKNDMDIYVRRIDGELPLRITDDPSWEFSPAWSPDGSTLAYLKVDSSGATLLTVPALGGAPRARAHAVAGIGSLQWLADGQRILISAKFTRAETWGHYILHLSHGELEPLGPATDTGGDDWRAACAPDGERVAFIHLDTAGNADVYLRSVAGGPGRRLGEPGFFPRSLVWAADGRSLIVAGSERVQSKLWRLDIESGEYLPLNFGGNSLHMPTLAGERLVYQDMRLNLDLWSLDLAAPGLAERSEVAIVQSTRAEMQPDLAADGRIAFSSDRSGQTELWVCEADGGRPYRVTDTGAPLALSPRWSPDGSQLAFELYREGVTEIHVVAAAGGTSRRVSPDDADAKIASWSPDGRQVIAGLERAGSWGLAALDSEGEAVPALLVPGAHFGYVSADGHWLYYARPEAPGLWRQPRVGGREEQLSSEYPMRGNGDGWRLCTRGALLMHHRPAEIRLMLLEPGGGWRLLKQWNVSISSNFAVSPAGDRLVLARSSGESTDLMLVEGFH